MRPAPEDAADDAFDQREYPIPERLESQRRAWRFERAGLWVLLGVILLALTGVFAGGPLSSRTLVSDSGRLTLAYRAFRTQRRRQPPAHRSARRAGHRSWRAPGRRTATGAQHPEPATATAAQSQLAGWPGTGGRLDEDGRLSLFLTLLPNQLGEVASRLEFAGESLAFDQFIYP